jgi:leucyl aminopeptidase (aminopeptidase T)
VLVIYNAEQRAIAQSLTAAAGVRARDVTELEFAAASRHGEEPPAQVAAAVERADVLFAATSRSISHTLVRTRATERGVRVATLPTVTEEVFVRAVPVNYSELKRQGERLAALLTSASTARVTSEAGTDLTVSLRGRTGLNDDGDLRKPGAFGNLPAGEAYIAPIESVGDGTIVFDASLAGYGLPTSPLRVTVEAGRAVEAETPAGQWLLDTLDAGGEHGRSLAELGIGTNPAAILTGKVLEDEKVIGTVHLAFGASAGIGGANAAGVHIDGVLRRPRLELDGVRILEDGALIDADE